MPVLKTHEIHLHYQRLEAQEPTDQPPLLMLSGMASDSASWQPVIESLNQNLELILPDNRCTGQTLPNPVQTDREKMVGDVLKLLDERQIDRVNILGHSMGGMLGWALAAGAPDRVNTLVAAAALPSVIPARIALFKSLNALRHKETEAQWFRLFYQFLFCANFFNDELSVDTAVNASLNYPFKQNAESFAKQVAGLESFIESPDLSAIECNVTLITGSHDVLATPTMIEEFAADKTFVETNIINNAAHALHWEQPKQFISCVQSALGTHP
ncbi:MAG: alpha/beta fold hydrolase [Granulosicoccus sp.]